MLRRTMAVGVVMALLAACAARGPASDVARARARDLGLAEREREAFAREVAACVRREQARRENEHPAGSLAVGVSGEAPGSSAGGLAVVGVMASAITAGIAHRWWKGIGHRAARSAEPGAASADVARPPAEAAVRPDRPVAAPDTPALDAPARVVDACLETVSARWRAHQVETAPAP